MTQEVQLLGLACYLSCRSCCDFTLLPTIAVIMGRAQEWILRAREHPLCAVRDSLQTTRKMGKANLLTKQPHLLIRRFYRFAARQIAVHFLTIHVKKQPKETRVVPRRNTHAHVQIHNVASSKGKHFYFRQPLGWMRMHPFQAAYTPQALASGTPGRASLSAAPVIPCQTNSNKALEQSQRGYASHMLTQLPLPLTTVRINSVPAVSNNIIRSYF